MFKFPIVVHGLKRPNLENVGFERIDPVGSVFGLKGHLSCICLLHRQPWLLGVVTNWKKHKKHSGEGYIDHPTTNNLCLFGLYCFPVYTDTDWLLIYRV